MRALLQTASPANRTLYGTGDGTDTFSYGAGDGAVTIVGPVGDEQAGVLQLGPGITPSSLAVSSPNGSDLVLAFSASDSITIVDGYSGANGVSVFNIGIGTVAFADGSRLTLAQLKAMAAIGSAAPGDPAGGATLTASGQIFSYLQGQGPATLSDRAGGGLLQLGAGLEPSALRASSPDGLNLVLQLSPSDVITIANGMEPGWGMSAVRFADGLVMSLAELRALALTANAADPDLAETPNQSTAFTYDQGAGAAVISLRGNEADTLTLDGILPEAVSVSAQPEPYSGNTLDLVLRFSATDSVTIEGGFTLLQGGKGIQSIAFADGTIWTASQIEALVSNAVSVPTGAGSSQPAR